MDKAYPDGFAAAAGISPSTVSVASGGALTANSITLTNGILNVSIPNNLHVSYQWGDSSPSSVTFHGTFKRTENLYSKLTNSGGVISAGSLVFSNEKNEFEQNAGSSSIDAYSGGGLIDMNGGTLTLGTLSSGATLDADGGTIVAPTISLTSSTFSASNTTLQTGLNQVANFTQNIAQAQALRMSSGDAKTSLNASVIGRQESVGSMLSRFKNNVTWSGGEFHFTGSYTQSVADSARQLIRNTYGSGVDVTFDQIVDDPTPADVAEGLTAAIVNSIYDENDMTGGAIFTEYSLNALTDATTVGGASGTFNIDDSVGFIDINGSQTATATGGKTLALLGRGTGSTIASGTVVADNGTIRLGTVNSTITTGGTLADVDLANNGSLVSQRGTYVVTDLSGEGGLNVQSGNLTVNALDITGGVSNAGYLTFGEGASWSGGSNTGTLTTSGADIAGDFSNDRGTWYLNDRLSFQENSQISNGTGTIRTNFTNLFDKGTGAEINPLNTITLKAKAPEEIRVIETELFTQYLKPEVLEAVKDHMTFDGAGNLVVTNAELTTTQRDDLVNAFKEVFGDSTNITFTGTISGVSENSVLNTAKVNQLQGAGFTGLVYFDRELEGENAAVTVGAGGIGDSVGFMGINDASGTIAVKSGKELVLIGKAGEEGSAYDLADGQAVRVEEGALTLGSKGLEDAADYSGRIAAVTASGGSSAMNVAAGAYTAGTVTLTDGAKLENDATLTIEGNAEGTGSAGITNEGTLAIGGQASLIGTLENSGTMTVGQGIAANGAVTNGGTLNVTAGGLSITGSLTNSSALNVKGNTLITSADSGFINSGTATLDGDLRVTGTLTNNGEALLNTNTMVVTGTLQNFGQIKASDDSEVYGTLTNTGEINLYEHNAVVGSSGRLDNSGLSHSITGTGTITVNGLLTNVNDADFSAGKLVLTTAPAGRAEGFSTLAAVTPQVLNDSTMTLNEVVVGAGTEFWNAGTVVAETGSVEAGGYMANGMLPPNMSSILAVSNDGIMTLADPAQRAVSAYRSYSVAGQQTNAGDAYYGALTIAGSGTLTNAAGASLNTGESTYWVDGTGAVIEEGGQLLNAGTAVLASSLENAGEIRGDGLLTFKHGGTGTNLFENSGTIAVGQFSTDGVITYTQTNRESSFTSESGWFEGDVINLTEGSMSHETAGTGNTYNLGVQSDDVIGNQATASFGTIDSQNIFNIYTGATLDVDRIHLTENDKTVHLFGGTLSTTLDQIFGDICYTALDIDADTPDDLVDVDGVKVATGVGGMLESVSQGIEFGWGTVAFDDAVYSASVVSDVLTKLDENDEAVAGHPGVGVEGGLEVTFNGKADQTFNVDLANKVKARPAGTDELYGSAYAVFAGETLTNKTQAHPDFTMLYVGNQTQAASNPDANILDTNIGFKQVVGASGGVTVADDHHFVLVGEAQSVAGSYALLDGDLTLKTGGMVTLGTYGTEEATKGDLLDVAIEDGESTLRVRHGAFTADAVTSAGTLYIGGDGEVHGGSILREDPDASFTVESYQAKAGSEVLNWGTFAAAAMTTDGEDAGSLTNYGTLDVGTAEIDMTVENLAQADFESLTLSGGSFANGASGTRDADFAAGTLSLKAGSVFMNYAAASAENGTLAGEFVNEAGAFAEWNALTVAANGELTNAGTITAGSLNQTGGTISNEAGGTFTLEGDAASSIAGTFENAGTLLVNGANGLSIAAGGMLANTGTMTAEADISITGGTLEQSSETAMSLANLGITGGQLVVDEDRTATGSGTLSVNGADASVSNAGTIVFADAQITQGEVTGSGTFGSKSSVIAVGENGSVDQTNVIGATVTNAGSLAADNLTAAESASNTGEMTLHDRLTGDLANNGALTLEGENGFTYDSGTLTNNGTFTASETVTLGGGHFVQASDTAAQFEDLTIQAGDLTVNAGKTAQGSALAIEAAGSADQAVKNEGTVDFDTITVTKGSVTGEGTLGAADSIISIAAAGSASQGMIEGAAFSNAGETEAGNLIVHAMGANSGVLSAENAEFAGSFYNDAAGSMTLSASLAGNLTNLGALAIDGGSNFTHTSGTITNNGVFEASESMMLAGGKFHQTSDTSAKFDDLTVTAGGLSVDEGKTAEGDSLTIAMTDGAEAVGSANNGTLDFDSITVTTGKIEGTGTLGSDESVITIGENGTVEQSNVIGNTLTNAGRLTADEMTVASSATNTGEMTLHDRFTGALVNDGTLTIEGENGFAYDSGTLTNNGAFTVTETVTLGGGHFVQASDTAAQFEDLAINAGDLTVNAGKTAQGGNLAVSVGSPEDVAIANDGTVDFKNIRLTQGTIEGSGTFGSADSDVTTEADGAIDQGTVEADAFKNAGSTTADNLIVHGAGTNTGTVDAVHAVFDQAFENAAGGSMTLRGSLDGSINNAGSLAIAGSTDESGFTHASGTIENTGSLTATETVTLSGGTIHQAADTAASFTDLVVNAGGLNVDAGKGAEGESLTIDMTAGADDVGSVNNGTIDFGTVNVTTGKITGTGTLGSDNSVITVGENGSVEQSHVIGDTVTNAGSLTADEMTIASFATNTGEMTLHDRLTGDLVNDGTLTLEGDNGFAYDEGTLTNNGAFTASETVTLGGGHFVQASDTAAQFEDLAINAGDLTVSAGKTAQGEGLTVAAGTPEDAAIANEGTVDFKNIHLTQGSITGEAGTLGTTGSDLVIDAAGTVDQANVVGDTLQNEGSVTADNLHVVSGGTNAGSIDAVQAVFDQAFDNAADGSMTLHDSLAGSINNAGALAIEGENGFRHTSGTIENTGALTATETVTLAGGTIHQASDTAASFTDLVVNEGGLNVDENKTAEGGSLTIDMTAGADAVGSVNNGTVDFGSINVTTGRIEGTGTLGSADASITVGQNGSVSQGQVIAEHLVNAGSIAGNVTADHGANAGTISAGGLRIEGINGTFVNTGTITTTGSAQIAGFDNQKDIALENGGTFTGTNVNTGSVTSNGSPLVVESGTTTTSGSGSITANAGLNVGADGKLRIEGPDAVLTAAGGASISGELASSGHTTIDKIAAESTGTITAAGGELHIGDLTDAEGMTFTQTADTNLTFDKGWFENSTINIQGGHFDASIIKDDEGNASGMLGENTVNITGSDPLQFEDGFDEKPSAEKQNWSDKYVTVKVDKVNADTLINIGSGGVLDAGEIDLTQGAHEGEQTITVGENGALQTSLDQFFDHVATTVIDINAVDPETGKVDIVTDVIATTTVTDVKNEIASGIGFENGGIVVWDDEDWSVQLVSSVFNSLAEAGMINEDKTIEQHFLGDFMGDFTIDTAAALKEEQEKFDQSWVLDPGVVFDTTTLHNNSVAAGADNKGLVIGGAAQAGENQIDYSIGFQDVANADYLRVEGGKEFALVGTARPDDFDWTTGYTDGNKLLVDAADGGSLDIADGTFALGSNGVETPTVGWVNSADVAEDGSLVTKNGEFAVWNIDNEGTINVNDGSILHTNEIDNAYGTTQVAGGLTSEHFINDHGRLETAEGSATEIGELTSSTMDAVIDNAGSLAVDEVTNGMLAGSVANQVSGTMTVHDDVSFTGTLENAGTAQWQNAEVALGSWTNDGYEEGGVLQVDEQGKWTNNGTSVWDQMTVAGNASNTLLEEGEGLKVGTAAEGDAFTIAGTGSFVNSGRLDATEADMTQVDGSMSNAGLAGYNDMTIGEGGSSYNEGYEEGHKLTVADGGVHTNAGTSVWDEVLVEAGGRDVIGSDALGETLFQISGNYDNFGTVDATKAEGVTVVGALTNEEGAQANWDDLTIQGWLDEDGETVHEALVTNDGVETGDHLTIAAGGTHAVTGESTWNSITVDAGGTDRYGSDAEGESFTLGGAYVNNGTLDATLAENMIFTGSVANNGNAGYQDLTIQDGASSANAGYEKGEDLVIAAGGSHANSGTSLWNTVTVEEGGSASNTATAEGTGMKVGSDAEGESFVVAGTFENAGILDASDAVMTEVSGTLANAAEGGHAAYDDMTIAEGGFSQNAGCEQGDQLVIQAGATHVNTGTSIWNGVTIDEGGRDLVGSDAAAESFEILGKYENSGVYDASQAETVTVEGGYFETTETGVSTFNDLVIAANDDGAKGTVVNNGSETGDKLHITAGGQHWTTGTSDWNEVLVDVGGLDQFGGDAEDESFTIGGTYVNNGTITAADAETIRVEGSLTNNGNAFYDDMTVAAGGKSDNTGYEKGDILTVNEGGVHTNTGTSIWNGAVINGSATNGDALDPSGPKGNDEDFASDVVFELGTAENENDRFEIAGAFENHGMLQASEAETTLVAGAVENDGRAWYDDMTISGESASSVNSGYEQGDVLTIEGSASHGNIGTSIWNNVTVGAGSSATNGEELAPDAPKGDEEGFKSDSIVQLGTAEDPENTFVIDGAYANHGVLDASETETTTVAGELTNDGQAQYDDMTIELGGKSENDGLEVGDILTVEGEHENAGTSIWNNVMVAEGGHGSNGAPLDPNGPKGDEEGFESDSNVQIGSAEDPDEKFEIDGTYENHGKLDASEAENTLVGRDLANDGQAWYDDMTVEAGGKSENSGYEQGDILTVEGEHENTGTSIWNNVTVAEGGHGSNGAPLDPNGPKGDEEGFESDSIVQIGTAEDPENTFEIDGSYENHGVLDASETETTTVAGDLSNDGQAHYDDMTIELGGSSDNSGYEQGDILTVEGEHENAGTSIWNNVTVAEGGHGQNGEELAPDAPKGHEDGFESDSTVVIGSEEPDEEFNINGDYENHGNLDASETENTNVDGNLSNDGKAEYDDMTVADGGHSENDGYEHGHDLTIEEGGSHENTGVSIWDNVTVAGSEVNTGDQTIGGSDEGSGGDEFVIGPDGDYTNNGSLDATDSENTRVDGDITNNGDAHYDDMDVNDGGHSTNNDYEEGDILDVNDGGEWENNGESHWNNVNVNPGGSGSNTGDLTVDDTLNIGGEFDNTGDIDAGTVKVDDGVLDLGEGSITADETIVNGGDVIVGNHKPIADENRVDYDTSVNGPVNGHWWVIGNGDLSFGPGADELPNTIGAPDIPDAHNRLTISQNITIGETGGIAVGSDLWTDKDNHKDVGDGNLYFGSDSLTVIDSTILENGQAAFTGAKPGATVTVEDGAKLVLGNLTDAGDYVITSGFQTSGNVDQTGWIGGWTEDALWAPTDAGSGLDWVLTLEWDDTKVWVNAVLEDVSNKYPDISIPGNINESLEHCRDAGGPDQVLACTVIRNPDLSDAEKTRIINSVAEIGSASGAMAMAFNEATAAAESLESRLSMKGEAFNRDGSMKTGGKGHGLWVDILGSWTKADSYGVTGGADVGYDADSYGFIMGADHKLEGKNVIIGGAFSYTDGSLDSTGDLLKTSNDFSTFGIHGYAAWKPTEKTNLVGTVSFMRSSSEAVQGLPAVAGFSKAEADIDTNMFVLGVRGEGTFEAGSVQVVPHAGLRMVVADTSGYNTKLDGEKAYRNDAKMTTTFQMPIGVAVRYDHQTASGWTIRSTADFSIIPQFGDTEQDTRVTGTGGATDTVRGDFAGNYAASVQLGIQAETKDNMTFGLKYGFTGGEEGKKDQAVRIEFRKLF